MTTSQRHRWGEPNRMAFKTERECQNGCGTIKVTRHEGDSHWTEYWRGLDKLSIDMAPACEKVEADA